MEGGDGHLNVKFDASGLSSDPDIFDIQQAEVIITLLNRFLIILTRTWLARYTV